MRVIRSTVDATRTAIDDPTGAYTDLVAALNSLGDDELTSPTTWDRYDPRKVALVERTGAGSQLVLQVQVGEPDGDELREGTVSSDLPGRDMPGSMGEHVLEVTLSRPRLDHPPRPSSAGRTNDECADGRRHLGPDILDRSRLILISTHTKEAPDITGAISA